MLQGRRTTPLPIPGPELERMRTTLAERYGSQVWDQAGARVLVVRVPRAEPDMVKDIEEAVEILNPGDVQDLTHALLVGSERVHAVATQPFADLMSLRVQQDQKEAARWRPAMARGTHQVVRLPHDVHRLQRLVLRLKCGKVAELDDKELDVWARELVPKMGELPYAAARVVYLVADHDDVRLDADLFLQDLQARWQETGLQERLAAELVAKQEEARHRREKDRASLLRDLRGRFPRMGTAPLKRLPPADWEAEAPTPAAPSTSPSAAPRDRLMYDEIDSLAGFVPSPLPASPRGGRPPEVPVSGASSKEPLANPQDSVADGKLEPVGPATGDAPQPEGPVVSVADLAPAAAPQARPEVLHLKTHLEARGFRVLLDPGVPGHALDLAAERTGGEIQRVVARFMPRLGDPEARALLETARALPVDLALAVSPEAEAGARRRFIATKARWIAPTDVDQLAL